MTLAEAAGILRVREADVREWVEAGLISYVTGPSGGAQIQLLDEQHEGRHGASSSWQMIELGRGISPELRKEFSRQRALRVRELELDGLDPGEVDVEALTTLLAARLAAVVPDRSVVRIDSEGMVSVAGSGIDVAWLASFGDGDVDHALTVVGAQALEKTSESLSEHLYEPWPARSGQFPGGFPPCNAAVVNGELRLSYGDPDNPILTLEPIPVRDVVNSTGGSE